MCLHNEQQGRLLRMTGGPLSPAGLNSLVAGLVHGRDSVLQGCVVSLLQSQKYEFRVCEQAGCRWPLRQQYSSSCRHCGTACACTFASCCYKCCSCLPLLTACLLRLHLCRLASFPTNDEATFLMQCPCVLHVTCYLILESTFAQSALVRLCICAGLHLSLTTRPSL